jgi:uncharacterized membrane protein (DUF373 family)
MKNMLNIVRTIEKTIVFILIVFLAAILLISVIDLGIYFFKLVFQSPIEGWYEPEFLMPVFSSFLVVLIGIELLETIKAYLKDDSIHVELVILVALIALARKIIVLDYYNTSWEKLIGLASLIIALGTSYFLIKKTGFTLKKKIKEKTENQEEKKR